jgi:hypothetical protein
MVITVEPGCYFNPALLLPAFEVRRLPPAGLAPGLGRAHPC